MSMRYPGGLIATSPVNARYPSGVWTQAQAAPYQAQNVWTRDQFWPNTTLLLQGDGAVNGAQNNTFLDSSSNNFTITRNGNTTQGSFTPYEQDGYWSNYFSGSQSVSAAASSAFQAAGNFTMECWVFRTGTGDQSAFVQQSGSNYFALNIDAGTGFNIYLNSSSPTIVATDIVPATNTWMHVALVRNGSTVRIYLNGVASATTATNSSTLGYNAIAYIGALGTQSAGSTVGYISNFRYVVGTAVYTSNFTPPAAPLTAITNTSLLTCQSNRFRDNSTNAFAITANGSPSVQAFQPFPGATTWSASVLGGSGYFDGNGDYLSVASNAAFGYGTGDFTIECWFNIDSIPGGTNGYFIIDQRTTGSQAAICAYVYADSTLVLVVNGGVVITGGTVIPKQWNHFALARSGTTTKMFLNGVQVGSNYTDTNNYASLPVIIGARFQFDANQFFPGYISNFRILKGTALYTTTFTPPTTPLTAITNTSLLLNMTNAGIYDNSMMNNLETVGNAQVSTSVVKYGTGSMAFDGSGDYLQAPTSVNANFQGGDFTIEFWMYASSQSLAPIVHQTSLGSNLGWIVWNYDGSSAASTRKLTFMANGASFVLTTSSDAYVDNTWTHIAVVKNGTGTGNIKIYSNGVPIATGTYATALNNATQQPLMVAGIINGVSWNTTAYFNGYIDDLRITKGAARYIGNFTPPPARLPAQ